VVVVLNWNGRKDTLACIESLESGSPDAQLLVVDNGSFDGALASAEATWPRVRTLQLTRNLGFAGGMNAGVRHALVEMRADVVTILNNDTVIPAGTMGQLREAAGLTHAVSPVVRYRDDPERIWFGEASLDRATAYPYHTAEDDFSPCVDGMRPTSLLAGCCITAHADVWRRVGLFDERFFLNFEDSEWSLRAMSRGVSLGVVCGAEILHAVSASFTGAASTLGTFYFLRNGLVFNRIAGGGFLSRLRFLRRFGLQGFRTSTARSRLRALLVLSYALAAYAFARYGEAPRTLRERAAKWNLPGVITSSGEPG
jgi:GT2 family glycosyltransferase